MSARPRPGSAERQNSLGLSEQALVTLFAGRDGPATGDGARRRGFVRWPFQRPSVRIELQQPGSSTPASLRVACRNLSAHGIGLLHNCYVHTGSVCRVWLPHPTLGEMPADGTLVRCVHARGLMHELGVKFSRPIPVREYIRPRPLSDWFTRERVEPESLRGSVLLVSSAQVEEETLRHMLRETSLAVRTAVDAPHAIAAARCECDIVLLDLDLPGCSSAELVASMREAGVGVPIVVLAADLSPAQATELVEAQVSARLPKPYRPDQLLRVLTEFLAEGAAGGLQCRLPADHPDRPLAELFVRQLEDLSARLEKAMQGGDAAAARTSAWRIAAGAQAVGFDGLTTLAAAAIKLLDATQSVNEASAALRRLHAGCRCVRAA